MGKVYLTNEKGTILVVSILILAVLSLIGAAATMTSSIEMNIAGNQKTSKEAFYAAEAGIEHAKALLLQGTVSDAGSEDDPDWNSGNSYTTPGFDNIFTIMHKVEDGNVVTDSKGNPLYVVSSIGNSSRNAQKQIEAVLGLTYPTPFDFGVFGDQGVTFRGNGEVDSYNSNQGSYSQTKGSNGDIGTNVTADAVIDLHGNARVNGDAVVGPGGDPDIAISDPKGGITGEKSAADNEKDLTALTIPEGVSLTGSYSLSGNNQDNWTEGTYDYDSISISGNGILTLDGDITIYVSELRITGNGGIQITEGSSVTIYFTDSLDISGNGIANSSQLPPNLLIYGTETATEVKISGNAHLKGAIYAPEADIRVTGNGNIYGSVVGDTVRITGNGDVHYDEALADIQLDNVKPDDIIVVSWLEEYY